MKFLPTRLVINQLVSNKNGVITALILKLDRCAAGQAAYQPAIDGERSGHRRTGTSSEARLKLARWITLWSKPNERFAGYVREVSPAATSPVHSQLRWHSKKVSLSLFSLDKVHAYFLVRLKLMS